MMSSTAAFYTLTFALSLGFMALVVALLLVISVARQMQLQANEEKLARTYHLNAAAVRRYIPLINAPTEKITPWYVRIDETSTGIPK